MAIRGKDLIPVCPQANCALPQSSARTLDSQAAMSKSAWLESAKRPQILGHTPVSPSTRSHLVAVAKMRRFTTACIV
ncbi:hypothetical protein HZ326_27897 [Fusarium oxysporum f. sp. albedinis]|nr:hypothetical protein HZ326_27897 [Fusarium oxysporum f. sp. albedinis]